MTTLYAKFAKHSKTKTAAFTFQVKGEEEKKAFHLNELARKDVVVSIDGGNEIICELTNVSTNSNQTTIGLLVKGNASPKEVFEFYEAAGTDVNLTIKPCQMSLEEYNQTKEGKSFTVDQNGVVSDVEADQNQVDLFETGEDEEDLPFSDDEEEQEDEMSIPELGGEENE